MVEYNKWHADETLTWFAIHRDGDVYLEKEWDRRKPA